YGCESADFKFLLQTTELTKGTLSKHLSNLEETGYVDITKSFKGKYPNTSVSMTPQGRKAFKTLRKQYQEFIEMTGTKPY
ncbi:MAG: transcriptional regulator, partial [Anaerolineales bacterium]